MGRGGKVNTERDFKRRVRPKEKGSDGSDDSDEDYVLENEENVSEEDDFEDVVNSLDGYASEESFQDSVEVEEEEEAKEEEERFKKAFRSKRKKGSNRTIGGKTSRKRKRVSCEEEEEDEDFVNDEEDEDYVNDEEEEYIEEEDDKEADDDEEFTPEEEVDEEEDFPMKKNNSIKVGRRTMKKRGSAKGKRRGRKSRALKKPSVLKGQSCRRLRKKQKFELDDEDDADFIDSSPEDIKKSGRKNSSGSCRRRRRYVADSDSDFMSSRSSDCEYTISEDEREQVKEASKLFGDLKTSLRSSLSTRRIQENGDMCQQNKNLKRKGKEKAKEVKVEVGKQVCGICLSEEDKRRSRGSLNCCSHYFCFACIMEWSKVESRCPLCKQRFKTITKHGRLTIGVELRNMVIEVPERDQVYQPTEEEIRSFIDPYENVICTECHQGGDDGLMLLCDICDSPAHTYCVGLGQQVPEGNWYCDGCRPVALRSSSTQPENPSSDQRITGDNVFDRSPPLANIGESSGLILESSPCLAFSQGSGNVSSPRFPIGDVQAAYPVPGAGAATLSVRRQLHRHIQNLISINRMNFIAGRTDGTSASNFRRELLNPLTGQGREAAIRNSRTQEIGMLQNMLLGERILAHNHSLSSIRDNGFVSLRPSQFGRQGVQDPIIVATDRPVHLTLWPELSGTNSIPVNQQFHQCDGRSSVVPGGNFPIYGVREQNQFYALKEQLQSMVKSHLRNLSQDIELGHDTFKDIARSSTHTILAACGLEHRMSEVRMVPPPSICAHVDRLAAGETSMMKGFCSSCFDSFTRDVVKRILDTRLPQWLSLGL